VAEFQEVAKQLGRICESNFGECDICDIRPFCPSKTFLDKYAKSGRAERLEEIVMAWAEEHPEQVYPTWWEYLTRIHVIFPAMGDIQKCVDDLAATPIPADIAQKLGIEPKEG